MILILSQNFLRCDLCDEMTKCALSCNGIYFLKCQIMFYEPLTWSKIQIDNVGLNIYVILLLLLLLLLLLSTTVKPLYL